MFPIYSNTQDIMRIQIMADLLDPDPQEGCRSGLEKTKTKLKPVPGVKIVYRKHKSNDLKTSRLAVTFVKDLLEIFGKIFVV